MCVCTLLSALPISIVCKSKEKKAAGVSNLGSQYWLSCTLPAKLTDFIYLVRVNFADQFNKHKHKMMLKY